MIVEERLTTYIDSLNWQIPACLKEVEKEVKESEKQGTEAATISAVTVPFFASIDRAQKCKYSYLVQI